MLDGQSCRTFWDGSAQVGAALATVWARSRWPSDLLTTVDRWWRAARVSRNTMSFALPESMREYIDARVRDGNYGNTSEYLRELIRHDQERERAARLRDLISDGLSSGDGRAVTDEVIADLRGRAFVGDRSRPRGYGHWPRMISCSSNSGPNQPSEGVSANIAVR